jgi:oligoendopeptidase F
LPWWDLFASTGHADRVAWSDATAMVHAAFASYSDELAGLASRAFAQSWVDAEMREGKRGGAFCMSIGGTDSRVLMNFDESNESVSTLAHELGHAFHNHVLAPRTPLQRRLPMALAETASIFCETLLFEHSAQSVGDDAARMAMLDTYLVGASQVVVDIHSRFLFERELYTRRQRTSLSPAELSGIMADAQDAAYGDGLHPDHRHEYMWAVKPHYFTAFYNWPYTFGLLFGIGLYARFVADPDQFRAGYSDLLATTGMEDAATLAARFGIDVRDGAFWTSSLDVIKHHIDDYERLASG